MKRVWLCTAVLIGLSFCALPVCAETAPWGGDSALLRAIFVKAASGQEDPGGPSADYLWCSNWTVTGTAPNNPQGTCCSRAQTDASNRCYGATGQDCCQFGSCYFPSFLQCAVVGTLQCATEGDSCSSGWECCGGHCLCGTCTGGCQPQSNSCWSDCECCSGSCDLGQHQCN
jgi:hypothetical protein